jgi:hypothetical protein
MPAKPQFDPQYLDSDHQRISEFAADYFDDDEERAAFVDTLLERRGYQRTAGWAVPPPADPNRAAGNGAAGAAGGAPGRPAYFKR